MCRKQLFGLRWLLVFMSAAYLWGVLSIQHYYPSSTDLYINIHVGGLLAVGLLGWAATSDCREISVSVSTWLWLGLLVLVLLQPILNHIVYADGLIFPFATILFCLLVSMVVSTLDSEEKRIAVYIMAIVLLIGGVLTVASQVIQLVWPDSRLIGLIVFARSPDNRLIGNIAQVNQAVFVSSLGAAAAIYLFYRAQTKLRKIIYGISIVWLFMGVGFASSRGGLLLGLAVVLCSGLFYVAGWKKRFISIAGFGILFIIGYNLGSGLLLTFVENSNTAVSRLTNESMLLRQYLLQESWMALKTNWLTGIGWGNLKGFGLDHAEQVQWFTVAHHAHNLIAQIGAELGIIGLGIVFGFIFILIRKCGFNLSIDRAFAFAILVVIGMYSLSEYPLWFLRFIMIAAFFIEIALDGDTKNNRKVNFRFPVIAISGLLAAGSIYYIVQYREYQDFSYFLASDEISIEQKRSAYPKLPSVFGFSEEKEMFLFMITPISEDRLPERIALGNRVLSKNFNYDLLVKQGSLLAVSGNSKQADRYFRAACLFQMASYCNDVNEYLTDISKENPGYYKPYLDRYQLWYKSRFHKNLDN